MRIAFYAPLKSPSHPTPSGDREIARLLVAALARVGHRVELASDLRSYEGAGDAATQARLRRDGEETARRLLAGYRRERSAPDLWLTYHVYHKAPDWVGPAVCDALDIPYVVAEASVSPRAADGPWSRGHARAVECIARADAMVALNPRDLECAAPHLRPDSLLLRLPPFVERLAADAPPQRSPGSLPLRLVAVAMMRPGDKQRSWEDLAAIVELLPRGRWRLDTIGDGRAAATIRARLDALPGHSVHHHGLLEAEDRDRVLDAADLMLWPARNEAMGMALLEAQARGAAVIAGREGGVTGVVAHGIAGLLYPPGDVACAARYIRYLADRPEVLTRMRAAARERLRTRHHIDGAAAKLDQLVQRLCAKSY